MYKMIILGGSDVCLKNINDYQGTCSVFQLDPTKIIKSSMASNDTLDTLDTQETWWVFFSIGVQF